MSKTPVKTVMLALAAIAALVLGSAPLQAQDHYPERPVRLVVGFAAGGPADIIARLIAAKLTAILGQQVFVENRTGASGNIATEYVARSKPDGYTLMMATPSTAVNESLFKNFSYKVAKDFVAVAPFADTALVVVVNPSLKVRTIPELIALAKSKPDQLFYATAGKGTSTHIAAELFSQSAGIKMTPVHYRGGGDTIKDLLSGQVKLMFSSIPPVLPFIKGGRLDGIATTGLKRDPSLPKLPTIAESGVPGFDIRLWLGLLAPVGTPPEVVNRLAAATKQALLTDDLKKSLAKLGYEPMYGSPAEFAKYYQYEAARYAKLISVIGTIGD